MQSFSKMNAVLQLRNLNEEQFEIRKLGKSVDGSEIVSQLW